MKIQFSNIVLAVIFIFTMMSKARAQDPHFTQFYNVYQQYNPAYIGPEHGDLRMSANYRRQWASIKGYTTQAISTEYNFNRKKKKPNYLSSGLFILNDQAGKAQIRTFQILASVAYHMLLTEDDQISAGLQFGYLQRGIDASGLAWDSQYDGTQYDPTLDDKESLYTISTDRGMDISPGVLWRHRGDAEYSFGYSFRHTGQQQSHIQRGSDRLPIRQTFTAQSIKHGRFIDMIYDLQVQRQKGAMEIMGGMRAQYRFGDESRYTDVNRSSAVFFGFYYRYRDAFSPVMGFEWKRTMSLFISYDLPLSGVRKIVGISGGPEFSFVYNPSLKEKKKLGSGNS